MPTLTKSRVTRNTSPAQQGVRTPLRTRFLDRTRSFWDLY
nr:MAG TPA_asm: hypothetical protein [Caudoviricetes sp.]